MKKLMFGAVSVLALGAFTPAVAADLPARTYSKAPAVVAAVYDWSGFYIGANGGYGWSKSKLTNAITPFEEFGSHTADGAVVGGQIGYRWQAAQWVFGVEAQGDWADITGTNIDSSAPDSTIDRSKLTAFGLFTGQVGYAWNNALLYVKGGAAITSNRWEIVDTGVVFAATSDKTRWGGAIGAGLEYGFAPNWSVGVEYDHLFIGRTDQDFYFTTGARAGILAGTAKAGGDVDLVTARVNYRFGGPVVARY